MNPATDSFPHHGETPFSLLNDDILSIVASQMNTVRDVANFASTSRNLRDVMNESGWYSFFQSTFPLIRVPAALPEVLGWQKLAVMLATQERAWERRSIDIYSYGEYPLAPWDGRYLRGRGPRSREHATPIDVKLVPNTKDEVIACGAGHDLMVKRSAIDNRRPALWIQHLGQGNNFNPGDGDITALSVLLRDPDLEIITGRANGQVQLQRLVDGGIEDMQHLSLICEPDGEMGASLDTTAISSMEWEPTRSLLATTQNAHLRIYSLENLPESERLQLRPMAVHEAAKREWPIDAASYFRALKFLNGLTVACGVEGSRNPLLLGKITPPGLVMQSIPDSGRRIEPWAKSVNAIESVGDSGNLILSAWCDGTIRLIDVRTAMPHDVLYHNGTNPSHSSSSLARPQDVLYRNGTNPSYPSSSLITHGLERFVAGSNVSPDLYFFDYRNPMKVYHYTDALPCSGNSPYPGYNFGDWPIRRKSNGHRKCDPMKGISCRWHRESRKPIWRPDATMRLKNVVFERVVSLARSCDFSDTFYCGMHGGLLEMRLAENWKGDGIIGRDEAFVAEMERCWDSLKSKAWSRKQRPRAVVTMEEIGVGRLSPDTIIPEPQEHFRGRDINPDALFLDQTEWTREPTVLRSIEADFLVRQRLERNWLRNRFSFNAVPPNDNKESTDEETDDEEIDDEEIDDEDEDEGVYMY